MNTRLALLLAAASTAAMAVPAAAQDNSAFTGPRVEAIVGYDINKIGSDLDNDLNEDANRSVEGLTYGIGVGYDVALSGFVLGVEGEYTDSTADTDLDASDFGSVGVSGSYDAGRDLYVGARAGVLVTPRTLAYVKGGYTNARFNLLAGDGQSELDTNLDLDGWRIGAGLEQAITDNAFAKLEYRYSNYTEGEFDFVMDDLFDEDTGDSTRFDTDLDRHQVVASVGLRF